MGRKMLNFAWPWMIIFLPLPILVLHFAQRRRITNVPQAAEIYFPKLELLRSIYGSPANRSRNLNVRSILLAIAWLTLIFALMRPELIQDIAYANNSGYDLMLAVDLSRSMETADFKEHNKPISRIAATKKVVANFVQQRSGDRIGLIVFGAQAVMAIPLTLDSKTVVKMLNNLMVGMAGESTAIGDAIGIGVKNLRKRPQASRVLILLTDGEDNTSNIPPLQAAKIAADNKVKIYIIGVGNKLDEKSLSKITDMTGGTYSNVATVDALQAVYSEIDKLESSDAKQQAFLIKHPLYQYSLFITLLSLGLFVLLSSQHYRYSNEFK